MNDNSDHELDRLFAAARRARTDFSAVEEHFETRLIARIRERRENRQCWYSWLWRLVPVFTVIVLVLGIASVVVERDGSPDMFAAIANGQETAQVLGYLTGE